MKTKRTKNHVRDAKIDELENRLNTMHRVLVAVTAKHGPFELTRAEFEDADSRGFTADINPDTQKVEVRCFTLVTGVN